MSSRNIQVGVEVNANVKGGSEVDRLAGSIEGLADSLDGNIKSQALASAEALRELGKQNAAIEAFVNLKREGRDVANRLLEAQQAAEKLGTELAETENPTRSQTSQLRKLHEEIRVGSREIDVNKQSMVQARAALDQYGISTTGLGATQASLRAAFVQAREDALKMVPALAEVVQQTSESKAAIASAAKVMDESFRVLGVQSVRSLESEIGKLQTALAQIKGSADILPADKRAAVAAFNTEVSRLKIEATGAGAGMQALETSSASTGDALAGAAQKAVAWAAALGGLSAIKGVASDVIETGAQFETLRVRLENLLGGTEKATQAFGMIKNLAATTPFEVNALTESFVKLTAMGMQPTESQMRSLSDVAANLGGGTEVLTGVTTALGQAWAKSKLQGEEINQLAERGVPVWDALTQATGRTVPELQRMAEAGTLGRDVITKLIDALGQQNLGASAKLMNTYSGAVSNAKDAMAEFYDLVAKSGVLDFLTRKIQGMLAEFERMKDTGELEKKAKALADSFISIASAVEQAAKVIAFLGPELLKLGEIMVAMKIASWAQSLYAIGTAAVASAAGVGTLGVQAAATAVQLNAAAVAGTRVAGVLRVLRSLTGVGLVIGAAEMTMEFLRAKNAAEEGEKAVSKLMAERPANGPKKAAQEAADALDKVPQKASDMRKTFDLLIEKGDTAAEAIGKIGKDFDLSTVPGIRDAATVLDGLAVDGKLTAEQFGKAWTDNLKGIDLKEFETRARQAFDKTNEGSLRLVSMLDVSVREAIRRTGLDFEVISGGMGKASQSAISDTDAIIKGLDRLKTQGVNTAQALTASLGKGIDTADSQKAVEAVKLQIESVRKVLGDKVADGLLDQAKQKSIDLKDALDKATPGINGVREAMKLLGVTSDQTFKDTAEKSKAAYDAMKVGGTSSARELADGFKKMAADQIAASGEVGSSQRAVTEEILKSEGAVRGLSVSFDANGKLVVQTQAEAAAAIAKTTGALDSQKEAVDSVTSALERKNAMQERANAAIEKAAELERKRQNVDKEGYMLNTAGERISISKPTERSVYENAKGQGLTEAQALQIANQFIQNGQQAGYGGANTATGENWGTELQKAIDKLVLANAAKTANTDSHGISSTTASGTAPVATRAVNINLSINNSQKGTVDTSPEGATVMQSFMNALQQSKLSSGL